MIIRDAEPTDFSYWAGMVHDYDSDIKMAQAVAAWRRFMSLGTLMYCKLVVAEEPIAFMHFNFHDFCFSTGPVCYLSDLYVSPNYRRRGIARALLTQLMAKAKTDNWSRVYWVTEHENPARGLYDEFGIPQFVRYHYDLKPAQLEQ